jgi:hypothetical protein
MNFVCRAVLHKKKYLDVTQLHMQGIWKMLAMVGCLESFDKDAFTFIFS